MGSPWILKKTAWKRPTSNRRPMVDHLVAGGRSDANTFVWQSMIHSRTFRLYQPLVPCSLLRLINPPSCDGDFRTSADIQSITYRIPEHILVELPYKAHSNNENGDFHKYGEDSTTWKFDITFVILYPIRWKTLYDFYLQKYQFCCLLDCRKNESGCM